MRRWRDVLRDQARAGGLAARRAARRCGSAFHLSGEIDGVIGDVTASTRDGDTSLDSLRRLPRRPGRHASCSSRAILRAALQESARESRRAVAGAVVPAWRMRILGGAPARPAMPSWRCPERGMSSPPLARSPPMTLNHSELVAIHGRGRAALFLIDGNSLVYRAFFALPESIATSTGEPTNAIFGFASMLVKLITDHGLTPTVVAWDAGASGRTEIYPDYKAQRRSRPDLLREQWPAFEPLVDAFGFRNARLEGFEADDVIATLAQRATTSGSRRDRHRRPRRLPAGRRRGARQRDGDGARDHRDERYDRSAVSSATGSRPS